METNRMRTVLTTVLVLGLTTGCCAPADAASAHRLRARPHGTVNPGQGVNAAPGTPRLAVPGWSDEDTRRWMDNASALWRGA
jgi:hypothetical protein